MKTKLGSDRLKVGWLCKRHFRSTLPRYKEFTLQLQSFRENSAESMFSVQTWMFATGKKGLFSIGFGVDVFKNTLISILKLQSLHSHGISDLLFCNKTSRFKGTSSFRRLTTWAMFELFKDKGSSCIMLALFHMTHIPPVMRNAHVSEYFDNHACHLRSFFQR